MGQADRIAIIASVHQAIPAIRNLVACAGLDSRVVSIRAIEFSEHNFYLLPQPHEAARKKIVEQSLAAIREDGAELIVLGSAGMIYFDREVSAALLAEGYDVPVLESGKSGITMLEMYIRMGLCVSPLTYPLPPK